jgi:hypothetical protein
MGYLYPYEWITADDERIAQESWTRYGPETNTPTPVSLVICKNVSELF